MTGKIFRYSFLIGIVVLLLASVLFSAAFYRYYETQLYTELADEANYIARGMDLSGDTYLTMLDTSSRVTWVAADGAVLYDNLADEGAMENHLNREEIREALETGTGQGNHNSETMLEKTVYFARRLEDGSVLRVSRTHRALADMLQTLLNWLVWITVLLLSLSGLLSFRLARKITEPINRLDLDRPKTADGYPELEPLITRLDDQNRTIRQQMEELTRRQREFSTISNNMSEGLLILDARGGIFMKNRTARQFLTDDGILRPETCDRILYDAAETARSGQRSEARLTSNGRIWQVLATPVVVSGQTVGAVVLLVDVTEREQREALRKEFSANVSHELKTPLTSISGFAELMKEGMVPAEMAQEFSADIYRESQRLIALVDDIINLSSLDEGTQQLPWENVDLYGLAADVLASLQPVAEKRNIRLSLEGTQENLPGIWRILHEMVYNLCDNAIKYNKDGGSVTVSVLREDGQLCLTVADTGIGIPYAHQSRVFERFYRVDKSHSRAIGGTGLGLSIVKHGAQYHGARVELESTPGEGSKFTVRFPSGKELYGNTGTGKAE